MAHIEQSCVPVVGHRLCWVEMLTHVHFAVMHLTVDSVQSTRMQCRLGHYDALHFQRNAVVVRRLKYHSIGVAGRRLGRTQNVAADQGTVTAIQLVC